MPWLPMGYLISSSLLSFLASSLCALFWGCPAKDDGHVATLRICSTCIVRDGLIRWRDCKERAKKPSRSCWHFPMEFRLLMYHHCLCCMSLWQPCPSFHVKWLAGNEAALEDSWGALWERWRGWHTHWASSYLNLFYTCSSFHQRF